MASEQNQLTDSATKNKIITCFVHYNKSDDQSKLFDILRDFRTRCSLKFSHHPGYIFFTLSSEYLNEFSQVRPFKISKFISKSQYTCDKNTADLLMKQRDSFVRMIWGDDNCMTFLSRTPTRIHNQLVRRIFKDSAQEFDRNSYTYTNNTQSEQFIEQKHFFQEMNQHVQANQVNQTNQTNQTIQTIQNETEGFVKVEKKQRKPRTTETPMGKTKYNNNENKQQEAPKIRGRKTTRL